MTAVDVDQLAELARLEAERHAPRTPERRAAAHAWIACTIPPATSLDAVRRAIASFGAPKVQAAALELLHRLAAAETTAMKGMTA